MHVEHGHVEPAIGPVHLLEGEVGQEAAAHHEEGVHGGERVHDDAEQERRLELKGN